MEVPIQKEKEFRREGTGCFVGFLHFATNNIRHVGQDKGDVLLEDALEFLAVRAGRQRKDMEFRSKVRNVGVRRRRCRTHVLRENEEQAVGSW